jgi:hypothetical protein
MEKRKPPVIDYGTADLVYVDELAMINELGPVIHLRFVTPLALTDGSVERKITAHLIIPQESRLKIARALLRPGELRADVTEEEEGISLH